MTQLAEALGKIILERQGYLPTIDNDQWLEGKAKELKQTLWHDAEGDDLPPIDREVIVLCNDNYGGFKAAFGHRVKEGAFIKSRADEETFKMKIIRYGKGGWNIPDVEWWLDIDLPNYE